jgi:hypothetical protein|tara:strand:- start:260 stop:439 length:180 start_codon:yes stop_codon:yes gene_type:complete
MRAIKKCSSCNKKAVLTHHKKGYCGTVQGWGLMNIFGYCGTNKIDSPELIAYEKRVGAH